MTSTREITVWDHFVRVFHWSVAAAFLLDFWVLEEGDPPHEWVGYFLGVLLVLRIIWGFIGPHNARFINFFPTPGRIRGFLPKGTNRTNPDLMLGLFQPERLL